MFQDLHVHRYPRASASNFKSELAAVHKNDSKKHYPSGLWLAQLVYNFFDNIGPKAISYNIVIMKNENGGFSTFAGVLDLGRGRIGPALLIVRLAVLRDISNDVYTFFRRGLYFFSVHRRVLKISFGRHVSEK